MKTVAIITVTSPKVFSWLGHMPVMSWSVTQLLEVRGISRIVCAAVKDLAKRARDLLVKEDDDIPTVTIPDSVLKQDRLDKWLVAADGPAADADVIALVQPTFPFLPSAKIEGCIDLVGRNFADTACTAQEVNAWTSYGRGRAYAEVLGCCVYAPARVKEKKEKSYGRFRPVLVSLIESLDVTDADNHRLAKALVADGSM